MSKKMCKKESLSRLSLSHVLGYSEPRLHIGKTWYVDFFCFDPVRDCMRRKKFHLDSIKKVSDRKKKAAQIIRVISEKLRSGWNPWCNPTQSRLYTNLDDAIDLYLEYIRQTCKERTLHSYSSRVNVFKKYLEIRALPVKYTYQYDTALVQDYLDWLLLDREVEPRTYNNYRGWCAAFGEWMLSRKYIETNSVKDIHPLKELPKKRISLTRRDMRTVFAHLKTTDRHFLLACYFEYFTFIRPTELSYLRIRDISVKDQKIFVSGKISKNGRDAFVGLNKDIIKLMVELEVFNHPSDWFLFGKKFRPNPERIGPDQFNRRWKSMREKLKLSNKYQFYSLKDTGIRDLANSEGIVVARDQARHTDISTTNKYLGSRFDKAPEETKNFRGVLED